MPASNMTWTSPIQADSPQWSPMVLVAHYRDQVKTVFLRGAFQSDRPPQHNDRTNGSHGGKDSECFLYEHGSRAVIVTTEDGEDGYIQIGLGPELSEENEQAIRDLVNKASIDSRIDTVAASCALEILSESLKVEGNLSSGEQSTHSVLSRGPTTVDNHHVRDIGTWSSWDGNPTWLQLTELQFEMPEALARAPTHAAIGSATPAIVVALGTGATNSAFSEEIEEERV